MFHRLYVQPYTVSVWDRLLADADVRRVRTWKNTVGNPKAFKEDQNNAQGGFFVKPPGGRASG